MSAAHGKQYPGALAKSQKHLSMAASHGLRGSIFYSARISPNHNWIELLFSRNGRRCCEVIRQMDIGQAANF